MGTGIVSVLLHNLPWNAQWLQYVSYVFFAANGVLFVVFFAISVLRYALYPEIWRAMISHPGQSLFLGCFPMGFASKHCPLLFPLCLFSFASSSSMSPPSWW